MTINWKKSIIIATDVLIAAYLFLAVTAFNTPDTVVTHCEEVRIDVEKDIVQDFLTPAEVKKLLEADRLYPLHKAMDEIDTRQMEETLSRSPFVEGVECYKTLNGQVCVQLKQRMPVVRVMTSNGDSYYVDSHGGILPASHYITNMVIATGHIPQKYAQGKLAAVANYIIQDKFWRSQIVQINVLPDGSMEIVPRVGEHVVYLGRPDNIGKKLERLRKFYVYGLNKAGWNKYEYISLEFDNQIICKKSKRKNKI